MHEQEPGRFDGANGVPPGPEYPGQWDQTAATPEQPTASQQDYVVQRHPEGGDRGPRRSRRLTLALTFGAGLLVGATAAVFAGAASLATHLYVNSVTLPRDKVQQQVAHVLTDAYQVGNVKTVSCPSRIAGGKGTSFVCSYTVSGAPAGKVTVTILNSQGSLQVEPPST
jgi:hypothetical protein